MTLLNIYAGHQNRPTEIIQFNVSGYKYVVGDNVLSSIASEMIKGASSVICVMPLVILKATHLLKWGSTCDNVARPLNPGNDTGNSTDEYELEDVDDNTQSPTTASSNRLPQLQPAVVTASVSASCDVCLNAPRDKVALLPCGHHATFCQQCIDTLIATNSHCPVCRGSISTTVRFYNNMRRETLLILLLQMTVLLTSLQASMYR